MPLSGIQNFTLTMPFGGLNALKIFFRKIQYNLGKRMSFPSEWCIFRGILETYI
jgi:hypothetical protein